MGYGHAERTLATIRMLEAKTRELLSHQEHLDPEQAEWLRQAADSAAQRLRPGRAIDTRTMPAAGGRQGRLPDICSIWRVGCNRLPGHVHPGEGRGHEGEHVARARPGYAAATTAPGDDDAVNGAGRRHQRRVQG